MRSSWVVRKYSFMYTTHNSLGGILATDKVVDNIGVTNTLLNGLCVAQVVFLYRVRHSTFNKYA